MLLASQRRLGLAQPGWFSSRMGACAGIPLLTVTFSRTGTFFKVCTYQDFL